MMWYLMFTYDLDKSAKFSMFLLKTLASQVYIRKIRLCYMGWIQWKKGSIFKLDAITSVTTSAITMLQSSIT